MPTEKKIEVNGKTLTVKKPTSKEINFAKKVSNRVFSQGLMDPDTLLIEQLDKVLKEKGVWSTEKEAEFQALNTEILELEKKLKAGGAKVSEGKQWSVDLIKKKAERDVLTAGKLSFVSSTAEGQANDAYFASLVSQCVWEGPKRLYPTHDDYSSVSDSDEAIASANALFEVMSGLKSQRYDTPEYQFLKRFKFVDEKGRLVDSKGRLIDKEGRFLNEEGKYINLNGDLVDEDGNLIIEENPWVDDRTKPKRRATTKKSPTKVAVAAE